MSTDQMNRLVLTPRSTPSHVRIATFIGTISAERNGSKIMPTDGTGSLRSPSEKSGRAKEAPIEPSSSALPLEPAREPVPEFVAKTG